MNMQTTQYAAGDITSVITPRFLLRVGGLPINCLDTLRFEQTIHWQYTLLLLENVLAQQKEQIVDILHRAVSDYKEDQVLRRKLINLKRDVFNMRMPRGTEEARAMAQLLSTDEGALLLEWLDRWERYQQQLTLGPHMLAGELEQKRRLLKEIINTPDFRNGILLSSPTLDQAIRGYMDSDNLHLNREARTVERSLLEYLFRAACKTSPFSTFTPVCIGMFEHEGKAPTDDIDLDIPGIEKQSFTRLNMVILARLSAQILASEEVRKALLVRVTNGWQLRNTTIEYVRRKPIMDTIDADAPVPLDLIEEHVIQLPVSSLLRDLLALLADDHEETLANIVARLCAKDGSLRAEATVEAYLQHLLRLGFLIVPALQVDIHHHRPLDAYCEGLRVIATPQTDALAQHLKSIASLVDTYAHAPLTTRAAILEEIRRLLQEGSAALGSSQQSIVFPRTLLYEDTTLAPERLAIQEENWAELFVSVSELQHILPIFDMRLPQRIITRGFFQARYGVGQSCDDFLSFADDFNLDFLRQLQQNGGDAQTFDAQGNFKGQPNYFQQPELEQLNNGRMKVAEYMRKAYEVLPAGSDELILEEDFTRSLAPLVPEGFKDFLSHTFFSQFARVHDEPLLILNHIYSGLTLMFSRFAYCFSQNERIAMVATLRSALERIQPTGAVFAELKGGYDATNLNLHPAITPYELVCPGELSTRAHEEQIPMEDLSIQDDVVAGHLRLFSKKLGKEVIPLYLGFLTPRALPEVQQILLNFSYMTISPLNLWSGTKIAAADNSIVFYPRLRYKQIVLQRATWKVDESLLPRRESGQSDADFFLAVTRWRKKLGLPAKVFVAPVSSFKATSDTADDAQAAVYQSYKPLCVDFENYFSVLLLEATIRKTNSSLQITEMLPLPEHLWFRHDEQAYVTEFVFEVSQVRRDHDGETLD